MSEWQPIETAPRDGTEIDVWVRDIRYPVPLDRRYTEVKWQNHSWRWFDPHYGGFGAWVGVDNGVNVLVTHWMPIPAAPVVTQEQQGKET